MVFLPNTITSFSWLSGRGINHGIEALEFGVLSEGDREIQETRQVEKRGFRRRMRREGRRGAEKKEKWKIK